MVTAATPFRHDAFQNDWRATISIPMRYRNHENDSATWHAAPGAGVSGLDRVSAGAGVQVHRFSLGLPE